MKYRTIKRKYKILTALLLSVMLSALLSLSILAAGNVSFEGFAEGFVFFPGSDSSPTDLFESFKDVMPGDSLSETIDVKNNDPEATTVKIYMRAAGAEGNTDFLDKLSITAAAENWNSAFNDSPEHKGTLGDWTLIATLAPQAFATINLTLDIPIELDNTYQNAAGTLIWEFKAEEVTEESSEETTTGETTTGETTTNESSAPSPSDDSGTKTPSPKTGDSSAMSFYIAAAAVCGAVIAVLLIKRRRSQSK